MLRVVVTALVTAMALMLASPAAATDVGLVDPASGVWFVRDEAGRESGFVFGAPGDVPILGDWDCDGTDTPGLYRPGDGRLYLRSADGSGPADVITAPVADGVPLAGDFNGDGCDGVAAYDPDGARVVLPSGHSYFFGVPGDRPFSGDFDGDGVDTVGLHRPATGSVYVSQRHATGPADLEFYFGLPGDQVLAGDWDGDGIDTVAAYRASDGAFFVRNHNSLGVAERRIDWGARSLVAVAGSTTEGGFAGSVWEDARAVLMVGVPGRRVDSRLQAHLEGGGRALILFRHNLGTADEVRSLTGAAACAAGGSVLVAIDQELGRITNLGALVSPTPSAAAAAAMDPADLRAVAARLGGEMAALGVNMDLAPVADVVRGPNPVMAGRHFGSDPEVVAATAVAFVEGMQSAGVAATAKHFPGHGLSRTDPHRRVTTIDATRSELEEIDLAPFRAIVAADVDAVMVGHPIYPALDPDRPASVSPAVLGLLRDLGFDGVAVTDALSMRGLTGAIDPGTAAVRALAAGEDLVLVDDWEAVEGVHAAVVAAVADNRLRRERLAEAAVRVRRLAAEVVSPPCG